MIPKLTSRLVAVMMLVTAMCLPIRIVVASPIDELQSSFASPPDDARIMMRWWWFGPTVEKAQLEREMRLMKEGGIGGFEVQPVYALVLDEAAATKTLPFLSDEFIDALRFTAGKARELGLRFDLTLGSGWPFGGPTVKVDHAAARLRYEHVKIDSSSRFVKVPSIGAGEKLLAVFLARVEGSGFAPDSVRELTDVSDGQVRVDDVPAGPHEVLFFISSRTGMQVKRPAVGGEGFVLDHLNRGATDAYLKGVGDRMMQAFGSQPPYAI
ncbi:MAG TPA: glycosyl hydrolase, partial [Pyrinomonadaceae bacterium]|nr:glycosyl hydrolase [Pyrinomonadaceae bacterium]